jgi:N-acetylmuramoyl-L-alanine amidase
MSDKLPVVVLDPGHGGDRKVGGSSANNATGPNGLLEKGLTLEVSRLAQAALAGVATVVRTRTADVNLSLADRAKVARDHNATAFVSIHFNGWHDPKVDGTEVWLARSAGAASQRLARGVLRALLPVTGAADRGVRENDLGVLLPARHAPGTAACLAELCFLTNPAQARHLADHDYLEQLGDALAAAVRDFLAPAAAKSLEAGGAPSRAAAIGGHPGPAYARGQSAGAVVGDGRAELDCPLLAPHGNDRPNLVLRWNVPPANFAAVDVVAHLHGYSPAGKPFTLQNKEQISGVDFSAPSSAAGSGPSRSRPTLGVIPRGHLFGGNTGRGYDFPALTAGGGAGLADLVRWSLDAFATGQLQQPVGSLRRGRLILTAHSGGGAALLGVLGQNDPDEVHLFDGLYQPAGALATWAVRHIRADAAALAGQGPADWPAYAAEHAGALRVFFTAGKQTTPPNTALHNAVACALAEVGNARLRAFLCARYRVERTAVAHEDIPRTFGWQLLADAGADVSPAPTLLLDPARCAAPAAQALDAPALAYGVPGGTITDPFYRNAAEKQRRTGRTKGRARHLGMDVSLSNQRGRGADDLRRGLPVYAAGKDSIDLADLNAVRAVDQRGTELTGLGIAGDGTATLQNAVVDVQRWRSQGAGAYGGVIGLACRYGYTRRDGSDAVFTLYLEYLHMITPEFLPKDGDGRVIGADEWQATGKGIGFGPRMRQGAVLSAADLSAGTVLVGYLGATEFPHVHVQAAYADGEKGYTRWPRFDPTVMLQAQTAPAATGQSLTGPRRPAAGPPVRALIRVG